MPTVYLHIGRGKTGTTAIQQYLSHARAEMLANRCLYLTADGGARGSGHQNFAKSFIPLLPDYMDPPKNPKDVIRVVADEIVQSTSDEIVISSENFPLADASLVRQFFADLPVPCHLKIIFFVRSQDELAESEYNQMVKLKQETRPFLDYANSELLEYDFLATLKVWEDNFGLENIICRIFDGRKRNSVSQFLDCLPSQATRTRMPVKTGGAKDFPNQSIGFRALTLARMLNETKIDNQNDVYNQYFMALREDDLPALFLSSADAAEFRSHFEQSNRTFLRRYMGIEGSDLGGRQYADIERDEIRAQIKALRLDAP